MSDNEKNKKHAEYLAWRKNQAAAWKAARESAERKYLEIGVITWKI